MSFIDDVIRRSQTGELREEDYNKELVYSSEREVEVIIDSTYKNVNYKVVNYGHHPCCYVLCSEEFINRHRTQYSDLDVINVHGGVTFIGKMNELKFAPDDSRWCFGWDYGHYGDWCGYETDEENERWGNHKWTVRQLVEHCKNAIDQYLDARDNDKVLDREIKTLEEKLDRINELEEKSKKYASFFNYKECKKNRDLSLEEYKRILDLAVDKYENEGEYIVT